MTVLEYLLEAERVFVDGGLVGGWKDQHLEDI